MRVLEKSGLVRSEKVGRVRTCLLNRQKLAAAERNAEGNKAQSHNKESCDKTGRKIPRGIERDGLMFNHFPDVTSWRN